MELKNIFSAFRSKHQEGLVYLADQLIMSGGNFIYTLLIASLWGLETLGAFSLVMSVYMLLLSMQQSLFYYPLENKIQAMEALERKKNRITIIPGCLLWSVISSAAASIAFYFVFDFPLLLCLIFGWSLQVQLLHDFFRKWNITEARKSMLLASDTLASFLQISSLLLLYWLNFDIHAVAYSTLLAYGATSIPQLIQHSDRKSIRIAILIPRLLNEIKECRYLIYSSILQWSTSHLIIIGTGLLAGLSANGILRLIQLLYGFLHVLLQTLEGYLPSSIIQQQQQLHSEPLHFLWKKNAYAWLAPYAALMFALIIMGFLLPHWISIPDTHQFFSLLLLFIPLYVFIYINAFLKMYLKSIQQIKAIFQTSLLGMLLCISLIMYFNSNMNLISIWMILLSMQSLTTLIYSFHLKRIAL
ncbi:MAG: hypothetical protein MUF42_08960 [Cytophagaceae bacterium]|jgi:O-antigen/teichoic acid export membrane protein|nr:hypothetical protein [Cytophagaceae bacterium]